MTQSRLSIQVLSVAVGALLVANTASAKVIADFNADFSPKTPKAGWAYCWNPEGVEIGKHSEYMQLVEPGGNWRLVVDKDQLPSKQNELPNAQWLHVREDRMTPGSPAFKSTDGLDHYVISAYTIQPGESGVAQIINSRIQRESEPGSSELLLFLNDTLMGTGTLEGLGISAFNVEIGQVNVGDTIYIALGPNNKSPVGAYIQFQIDIQK